LPLLKSLENSQYVLLGVHNELAILIGYYSKPDKIKKQRNKLFNDYLSWLTLRYRNLPIIFCYSDFNTNFNYKRNKLFPGKNDGLTLIKPDKYYTREQLKNGRLVQPYIDIMLSRNVICESAKVCGHPETSDHLRNNFVLSNPYRPLSHTKKLT